MSFTIDSLHYKLTSKFDNLIELSTYLKEIYQKFLNEFKPGKIHKKIEFIDYMIMGNDEYNKLSINSELINLDSQILLLYYKYNDIVSIILSKYYDLNLSDVKNDLELKENFDEYQRVITAENFVNLTDGYLNLLVKNSEKISSSADFKSFLLSISDEDTMQSTCYSSTIQKYLDLYKENEIKFSIKVKPINECECGGKMIMDPITSFKICDSCGSQIYMPGTVFDDSQFYNQNGQCAKQKKYDSDGHCNKWLDQTQATEDLSGPSFNKVIEIIDKKAVQEYTKNGILRSMKNMKCSQIRDWLKEFGLSTKWNYHTPLIRKTITGLHGEMVIPPQLTREERERVLVDFSISMELYKKICKEKSILELIGKDQIKNRPYYPFGLYKSLTRTLPGDPRLPKLTESIHFQSTATTIKNDKIDKRICEIRGKKYKPTDKTCLVEIN